MNVVIPEELNPSGQLKHLGTQAVKEGRDHLNEEARMKDKKRIELFIEKHKKLLLKLAK